MFTDPVEPVEVSFYWPEAVLGNFYWPGISSSLLLSSPGSGTDFIHQVPSSQFVLSTSYHLMHFSSDFIHQVGDWNWGILRYFVWSSSHICSHFSSDIFIRWRVLNQVALSSPYVQTTSYHCKIVFTVVLIFSTRIACGTELQFCGDLKPWWIFLFCVINQLFVYSL